jgi:hypothetical protein
MTPKTAPWFVHYGCEPGLYPDENFVVTPSIHKPTQTPFIAGPLGFMLGPLDNWATYQIYHDG